MRTRAQRRNTISGWLIMAILLAAGMTVATGLWSFSENQASLEKVIVQQPTPDAAIPVLVDEDSLEVAVPIRIKASAERPLWAMTRRPYVPPPKKTVPKPKPASDSEPEPPKEIPPLNAQLNSVIIAEGLKMIFLKTPDGIIRLEPGMSYNGWELSIINEDSAEFHFDEETKILQLRAFATVTPKTMRALGGVNNEQTQKKGKD